MKILMLIPVWRRPEVVAMFMRHFHDNPCPYAKVTPLFILSPEDTAYRQVLKIIEGQEYCETENHPLGRKKNYGLKYAFNLKWDYLMDMGSDDVYTPVLWSLYEDMFRAKVPYFGVRNLYVYDSLTDRALFVEGYHINRYDEVTAIGPGRCISREVALRCFPLWDDNAPFGMDGHSDKKIIDSGVKCMVIDNKNLPTVCDVKSGVALTPLEYFDDFAQPVTPEFVKDAFDLWCMEPDISDYEGFHKEVRKVSNQTKNVAEAFNIVNEAHEHIHGYKKYSSYGSYKVAVTRKNKKG